MGKNFSGRPEGERLALIVPGFIEDFRGRHGSFSLLQKALEKRGISSLAFDMGYSPSEIYEKPLSSLKVASLRIGEARQEFSAKFEKIFLIGASLGCVASALELEKNQKGYSGAVFWYPPAKRPKGTLPNPKISKEEERGLRRTGFLRFVKGNTGEKFLLGRDYLEEAGTLDTAKVLRKVRTPALILHPIFDSIVPFGDGERIFDSLASPDKTLVPMGGDHGWWNVGRTAPDRMEQRKAIKLTCEWIEKH